MFITIKLIISIRITRETHSRTDRPMKNYSYLPHLHHGVAILLHVNLTFKRLTGAEPFIESVLIDSIL